MLALTERAVDVIKRGVEANDLPEGAGLRIAAQAQAGGGAAPFGAEFAESPDPEDAVVEIEGARVFLDPVATPEFDDKLLDAQVQPTGGVTFGISEQEGG